MHDARSPRAIADRATPPRMSFEEYLKWDDEGGRAEWVDGEIVLMSPVSVDHQRLIAFLYELLTGFVRPRGLGEVLLAGVAMRLLTRPSAREPDVMFIAAAHGERVRPTFVDGPADLAIEVVSPDSVERDYVVKRDEYEAGGVGEYWTLDALRHRAVFLQRGDNGRFREVEPDAAGFYHSAVLPGFRLKVDWLWQRPLPEPPVLLAEIGA